MAGLLPVPVGILQLAASRPITVDSTHTPPYVAGYSNDARTIYLHPAIPAAMDINGKTIDPRMFIVLHEAIEKAKLDQSQQQRGQPVTYQTAHSNYATPTEHAALQALLGFGAKDIAAYDAKMKALAQKIGVMPNRQVPSDMDVTPYRETGNMRAVGADKIRG